MKNLNQEDAVLVHISENSGITFCGLCLMIWCLYTDGGAVCNSINDQFLIVFNALVQC